MAGVDPRWTHEQITQQKRAIQQMPIADISDLIRKRDAILRKQPELVAARAEYERLKPIAESYEEYERTITSGEAE